MAKQPEIITVRCGMCDELYGEFTKKELPKSFTCSKCGVAQAVTEAPKVGHSHKRNYPEGYFENQ